MQLLVIEDDQDAAEVLVRGLERSGHAVDHAGNGDTGFELALAGDYDVLVVDRMLPGREGLAVIAGLREAGVMTPALILSALDAVDDRVEGLRAGGDDYLTKPYALTELLARLHALVRRTVPDGAPLMLNVGGLELDRLSRNARRDGQEISLQPREYKLLEYLMQHAGQVVTRTMLLEAVWGFRFDPQTNVVDVHISRLRQKIDKEFDHPLLHTVRGEGYRLGIDD